MPAEELSWDATGGPPSGETDIADGKRGENFIYAARSGDAEAIGTLLTDGVPIGFRDKSGWTALRWAASNGHEDVLALLLEHGAAEDELENSDSEKGGGTSLHWAAYKGHVRLVYRLLLKGLSAKALDTESNTPLHLAAASGHLSTVKTLLSQGVDAGAANAYGNTALAVSTSPQCKSLLKEAVAAALDGRPYLCSCSGEFVSEGKSTAEEVIDRVSGSIPRPVRYSADSLAAIRSAEDGLTKAISAGDVPSLDEAIEKAEKIGASLPMISDGIAGLERLKAQIALDEATSTIQAARPLKERSLAKTLVGPLKMAKEKGVDPNIIGDAEALGQTVEAEANLYEVMAACEQ